MNSVLCGALSAKSFGGVEMWKKPSDFWGLKSVASKCWEKNSVQLKIHSRKDDLGIKPKD